MTDEQTPRWLRRAVSAGLLGGLPSVDLVVMRPFMVAIAWAVILSCVSWPLCIFACWRGCAATGAGLHSP